MREVVDKIKEIQSKLESREVEKWTPDQLSRAMTTLALLNMTLGESVVEAYSAYRDKEMQRKVGMAQLELELSKDHPMTVARTKAQVQGVELVDQENRAEYEYKLVSSYHRSSENLVSVLQSRLRQLSNERYQQGNNVEND